ncbi:MAG: tetratricopeptide repeat protein [Promethearchaeota archaeon]|jgi:tetratricopeptide (TPR) repeat protein
MKICPYCQESIEDTHPYCPFCNKPLISNLRDVSNKSIAQNHDTSELFIDKDEEVETYEQNIINDSEIERQIKKINEILESKEVIGDPIPGSLFLEKSSLFYKKRDLSNALKNLELALKNFEAEKDLPNIAICHNEIGLIQEDMGYYDQSIYHFNRSLEFLEEIGDSHKIIKLLNNLGNIYHLIKDLENSYQFYQKAIDLSKKEKLEYEEVKSSSNLVEILYQLRDFERIKRILKRNLEFFKEQEDIYGIITIEIKYGKLYYLTNEDYDFSFKHLDDALNLIISIKDKITIYTQSKLEWECFLYLGKIYQSWEKLSDAEMYFTRSLEAVRIFEISESLSEGIILENLAKLYSLKEDRSKAVEYYQLSSDIYDKFGDKNAVAEIKCKISTYYSNTEGERVIATKYLEEALNIYEELQFTKKAADILDKLGDMYIHRKMPERAITFFKRAKEYYIELRDEYNSNLLEEKINSLKPIN